MNILKTRKDELKIEEFEAKDAFGLRIQTGGNETGMLFRISAVFFVHELDIVSASIKTPDDTVVDEFVVRPKSPEQGRLKSNKLDLLRTDLERLLDGLSVLEYLSQEGQSDLPGRISREGAKVEIAQAAFGPVIRLRGTDRPGLMLTLSQAFFLTDIDILNASITTEADGEVVNTFEVNPADARFMNDEFKRRLRDELRLLL